MFLTKPIEQITIYSTKSVNFKRTNNNLEQFSQSE